MRNVDSKNIKIEEYKHEGVYPALEIDFYGAIHGKHDLSDMESVSNSICSQLSLCYNGIFTSENCVSHLIFNKIQYQITTDPMSGWIDIIALLPDDDIAALKNELHHFFKTYVFEYQDNDPTKDVGGVLFN